MTKSERIRIIRALHEHVENCTLEDCNICHFLQIIPCDDDRPFTSIFSVICETLAQKNESKAMPRGDKTGYEILDDYEQYLKSHHG